MGRQLLYCPCLPSLRVGHGALLDSPMPMCVRQQCCLAVRCSCSLCFIKICLLNRPCSASCLEQAMQCLRGRGHRSVYRQLQYCPCLPTFCPVHLVLSESPTPLLCRVLPWGHDSRFNGTPPLLRGEPQNSSCPTLLSASRQARAAPGRTMATTLQTVLFTERAFAKPCFLSSRPYCAHGIIDTIVRMALPGALSRGSICLGEC